MHEAFQSHPVHIIDGIVTVAAGILLMLVLEGEKIVLRRLGAFSALAP
jgi:hypothetical protein